MLVSTLDNKSIIATKLLDRKQEYRCPACDAPVTLKKGRIKMPHFAHTHKLECSHGEGEGEAHMGLKMAMYNDFLERGFEDNVDVFLECAVSSKRRTDILLVMSEQMIAIEIQHSPISINEIQQRTTDYNDLDIDILWVVPNDVDELDCRKSRVKAQWKEFHKMHCGIIFFAQFEDYYEKWSHMIRPVHFEKATSWVDATDFGGGYEKTLKATKTFNLGDEISVTDTVSYTNRLGQQVRVVPYNKRWF